MAGYLLLEGGAEFFDPQQGKLVEGFISDCSTYGASHKAFFYHFPTSSTI